MRELIVAEFITLDGVIQAPGGANEDTDGGFTQGGWTWPYWHDDIGARFFQLMSESDALLLGRKTWQIHGGAFEPMKAGDPFGDVMNGVKKYVVSRTLTSTSAWRNSTLIRDDVPGAVQRLKQEPGVGLWVGGVTLPLALADLGLIDEYEFLVQPVLVGHGPSLLAGLRERIQLELLDRQEFRSGAVALRFRPTRGTA